MKQKTSFGPFASLWDAKAGNEGPVTSQNLTKATLQLLGSTKGKNVYEIACGNGFLARKLAKAGARKVYASDVSKELIDISENKYDAHGINYSVREATDFSGLPKNYFDAVIIHQGVFYIKDIGALMKGVSLILKRNGSLIFTIHHPLFPVYRKDIGQKTALGKPVDIVKQGREYLRSYGRVANPKWNIKGEAHQVSYVIYNRPMGYYMNACGKQNLFIQEISEPTSKTIMKGVAKKSDIPSFLIIKAVKV